MFRSSLTSRSPTTGDTSGSSWATLTPHDRWRVIAASDRVGTQSDTPTGRERLDQPALEPPRIPQRTMTLMHGQIAILRDVRGPWDFQRYPLPDPEPGAILVKIAYANVC